MINSKTLKTFVQMHEYKLNAKLNGLRASQLDRELHGETSRTASRHATGAAQHWSETDMDSESRRRPHSSYFNFILTSTD